MRTASRGPLDKHEYFTILVESLSFDSPHCWNFFFLSEKKNLTFYWEIVAKFYSLSVCQWHRC